MKKYYVHSDRWFQEKNGTSNFKVFKNKRAAMRFFRRNPRCGQIDVIDGRLSYCWKYWDHGKIIEQAP